MLSILHVNNQVSLSGGVETYISDLVSLGLQYRIKGVWIGIKNSRNNYFIEYSDCTVNNEKFNSIEDLRKGLKRLIHKYKIDLFHVHSISDPKLISLLFELKPVLRTAHEPRMFCPGQGKFLRKSETVCEKKFGLHCIYKTYKEGCCNRHPKRLLKSIKNVIFETTEGNKKYSAIIAMSDFMVRELRQAGFTQTKVHLIPGFTKDITKESNEYSYERKKLLFVGRLSRTKGIHYFIYAGLGLLREGFNISVDIVGDGIDKTFFESLIPENYKEFFNFLGWKEKEQISEIIDNSYLLVFPSIYPEAFGLSGIEAMVRSKPVVAFDVGGVSTWLEDSVTGILVKPKDVEGLKESIKKLITNDELYSNMSLNSRVNALKSFTPEVHINQLKKLYNNILAR